MRRFLTFGIALAACCAAQSAVAAATVTPVQDAYGNVFPLLHEQSLSVYRSAEDVPWYVSFSLLTQSDVRLGALGLGAGSNGSYFDLTSIRLVTIDGDNVAFGSDTFGTNPFTGSIEALVGKDDLPAGQYALEVSGAGNRISCNPYCGDAPDFDVRLQVTPSGSANGAVTPVTIGPVQGNFGNVFPTLTEQSLSVFRGAGSTWYVSFDLLARANVNIGALGLGAGSSGSYFDLTSVRLVDIAGDNVAFGTDVFATSPFPSNVEALASAPGLAAGQYWIEVSGSGDRIACSPYCGDTPDFVVRLQVTPVPEPGTLGTLLAGLSVLGLLCRRRASLLRGGGAAPVDLAAALGPRIS